MHATPPPSISTRYRFIHQLIFLYLLLLIFEGAFRKWFTPGLSNPLLIIRDPLVILIYIQCAIKRCFPVSYFISSMLMIAFFSFVFGILSTESNLLITLYGLRINYLHIPLIFVMPLVMTREDVYRMGKWFLYIAIPMSVIIVKQFYSSPETWINHLPGGEEGIGLTGGKGKFRPSGTFAFVTGLASFYPIASAFLLGFIIEKKPVSKILMIASGIAIVVGIPFSMSRQLALFCAIVIIVAMISLYYKKDAPKALFRALIGMSVISMAATLLPFFDEGVEAFQDRWVTATGTTQEEFKSNIVDRVSHSFTQSSNFYGQVKLLGVGVGMGSNVATKLLTGKIGFMLAEEEWSKIIIELGPMLGFAFIAYRVLLTLYILRQAYRGLKLGNALPMLLMSCTGALILSGQWGPPTILGFAVLGGGMVLAACNPPHETKIQKTYRRVLTESFIAAKTHKRGLR